MGYSVVISGLTNSYDCNAKFNKTTKGVCGGASLTWLVNARNGYLGYHPHKMGKNLEESKRIMKIFCEGKNHDGSGTWEQRLIDAGKEAGFAFGRLLDRGRQLSTAEAFEVMRSLNGSYIILMGSHIMGLNIGLAGFWLLDNERGLYKGSSAGDLIDLLQEIRLSDLGPRDYSNWKKKRLTPDQTKWHGYVSWSFVQFR